MPIYTCPKDPNHLSTDPQYCSICGTKMEGGAASGGLSSSAPGSNGVSHHGFSASPASAASLSGAPLNAGAASHAAAALAASDLGPELCPVCGTERLSGARFCEVCRYNFATGGSQPLGADVPPPAPTSPEIKASPSASNGPASPNLDVAKASISALAPDAARPSNSVPQERPSSQPSSVTEADSAQAPASPSGSGAPVDAVVTPPSDEDSGDSALAEGKKAIITDAASTASVQDAAPVESSTSAASTLVTDGTPISNSASTPEEQPIADIPSASKPPLTLLDAVGTPDVSVQTAPRQEPARWHVTIIVDPALYTPDPSLPLPVGQADLTFPLELEENLIGRRTRRDAKPDIPIGDPGVSHRHAKLYREPNGAWSLLELGSTNGTRLNGADVQPGVRTPLQDGDQITLGCWTRIAVREY